MNIDLTGFLVSLCVASATVGALLMWLLPVVWGWLKPIIHQITA